MKLHIYLDREELRASGCLLEPPAGLTFSYVRFFWEKSVSISKRVLSFMSLAAVLVVVCSVPAGAGDCTPNVHATLEDQNTDQGENLVTFKFRVEVGQQGSSCVAINYGLILHIETSAGEEQVVQLRKHVKVNSSSVSMLVEHQISVDDRLASWEVADIECHACAPGD
jgi:hypothetical protein